MRALALPLALLAFLPAAPLDARQNEFRRTWTWFGDHLPIEVLSRAPGELRVLRGGRGELEVAGQSRGALLSAAPPRSPGASLRITAAGRSRSAWIIVVPEHVHVTVKVPDRAWAVPASTEPAATYRWDGDGRAVRPLAAHRRSAHRAEPLALTYVDATIPETVELGDLRTILRIGVRIEGEAFGIATTRPLELRRGDPSRIELRAGEPPLELVLFVPAAAAELRITAEGRTIAVVRAGRIETACTPVTLQTLQDGTRTADFTPLEGRLVCEDAPGARD